MFIRAFHVALSLAIVVGLYALYSLLVVPWIDPQVTTVRTPSGPSISHAPSTAQTDRLKPYFNDGDWETEEPIVVESPEFTLLLQSYESVPGGQVRIQPCTMVFFPKGRPASGIADEVLIMRAPGGAVLDFDKDCDLSRAKVGKLEGGRLVGEVSIDGNLGRAAGDNPSSNRLAIRTRDVELRTDRIWSRHEVEFRLGDNHGHGREMQLRFDTSSDGMQAVESFELLNDVGLFIKIDSESLLPGNKATQNRSAETDADKPPVEIKCKGSFQFDVDDMTATFEDRVDVVQHNPSGASDQLNCDLLTIYFAKEPDGNGTKPGSANLVKAKKIVAQGSPVIAQSPNSGGYARGNYLEVELAQGRLILEGNDPVILKHESSEITASRVDYTAGAEGELGLVEASGPGRLVTILPGEKRESFEASWKDTLRVQPHEDRQVISLIGGGRLQYADTGALQAEKIWLWLDKVASPKASSHGVSGDGTASLRNRISPHSALAITNVRLDATDVSAIADRLEVWFEHREADVEKPSADTTSRPDRPQQPGRTRVNNPAARPANPKQRDRHYYLSGRLMQVTIALPANGDPAPSNASISGNVRLVERMTAANSEPPLVVSGDHMELFGADTSQTVVGVTGNPAHVTGRGMAISGASLQLEKGTNRMLVNSAGGLTLPIDRDLDGKPLATAEPLDITWQGKMLFDGQTISFQRNVTARTRQQQLQTAELIVTLNRRLDFAQRIEKQKVEVATIACHGGVLLDNQTVERGQRVSHDRIQTNDMSIEQRTGRIQASGPGWVTSVRKNSAQNPAVARAGTPTGNPVGARPASSSAAATEDLVYLKITFRQGISGNLRNRELTFSDDVICTYGPVRDWNDQISIGPAGPRGNDILMTCKQLSVRQIGAATNGQRPIELDAIGDANVEAETFSAKGHRLAYSTGKELLVLEGTGQTSAELTRRQQAGSPPTRAAAQKILYWRAANRVEVQGIRFGSGGWSN